MRAHPPRHASLPTPQRLLTPWSPEFTVSAAILMGTNVASTSHWSANDPVAYPFRLWRPSIVKQLGWMNGTSAGGGVDVGIYDAAFNRMVSTGAQTGSGASAWQFIDVADTALAAGKYYLATSRDNTAVNRMQRAGNVQGVEYLRLLGVLTSLTDAYPLPDPLTNMGESGTSQVAVLGIKMQPVTW